MKTQQRSTQTRQDDVCIYFGTCLHTTHWNIHQKIHITWPWTVHWVLYETVAATMSKQDERLHVEVALREQLRVPLWTCCETVFWVRERVEDWCLEISWDSWAASQHHALMLYACTWCSDLFSYSLTQSTHSYHLHITHKFLPLSRSRIPRSQ